MVEKVLNSIGLTLSIIGAVLLFFYGFPQPTFEEGIGIGLEDANRLEDGHTVGEHNVEVKKKKTEYESRSEFAVLLIILGFGFQLVAIWIPAKKKDLEDDNVLADGPPAPIDEPPAEPPPGTGTPAATATAEPIAPTGTEGSIPLKGG